MGRFQRLQAGEWGVCSDVIHETSRGACFDARLVVGSHASDW